LLLRSIEPKPYCPPLDNTYLPIMFLGCISSRMKGDRIVVGKLLLVVE